MLYFPMILMITFVAIFIFGILLLIKITPSFHRTEIRWLMAFIISTCIVSFCGLNVYLLNSFEAKILFSRLRYIGYALIAQTWFFFLFINFSKLKFFKSPYFVFPFIIQMSITVILTLIPQLSHWVVKDFAPFHWLGANLLTFNNGPWFLVHITVTYLCGFISLIYAVVVGLKSEGSKRRQLLILSLGGAFGLVADAYCVITNSPLRWAMISGVGFLMAECSIYYAVVRHGLLNLSSVAKDEIFQSISDALIIIDQQFQLIDANTHAKERFHLSQKHFFSPLSKFKIFCDLDLSQLSQEIEIDQSIFLVRSRPLKNSGGRILIFHEVTMQKNQLRAISKDLDFKGELLKMITHDFSGILNLQSYLSTTLEQEVSEELKEKASALKNSSLSTRDMLSNVLLWAKSQQSEFIPVIRPFELNTLMREVITSLESLWRFKKIEIIQTSGQGYGPCLISGDSVMIESVIRNILSNAIRASSSSSHIEINTRVATENVSIVIKDFGRGISVEKLQRLKSLSNQPIADAEGFGIGLVMTKHFIKMHGGELKIESIQGAGTEVSFTLPT